MAGGGMASLVVRDLEDGVPGRLKHRAARRGRSAEAEPSFDQLAAELRTLAASRHHAPAEDLLRGEQGRAGTTFVVDARVAIQWVVEERGAGRRAVPTGRSSASCAAPDRSDRRGSQS